ncbi:MAG: tRNA pseudouridine(55) synthase TruB [Proteobacteria bacterium]|nr:tRNA pseudouridine(55) synthase TruB [Cystobacterineae bacterium]MCL2314704.1 tRNA pseudouridine(55) synthase TruB [Pseudomonadota bacterium]
MDGLLVVDKPEGLTSFEVVRRVRRLWGGVKVGHTGTLDPLATGVLVLCLGEACKLVPFLTELDKVYGVHIALGVETDSYDAQGKVLRTSPVPCLTPALLETHLSAFRGSFLQMPPMHSAIRQNGQRLYELARQGIEAERKARPVTVHRLQLEGLEGEVVQLGVHCSKGFFIRSLAHELGKLLGCGAHVRHLRRRAVGPFVLEQAVCLPALEVEGAPMQSRLISMEEALPWLPAHVLRGEEAQKIRNGVRFELEASPGRLRLVDERGHLLALAEVRHGEPLHYLRVFPFLRGS